MAVNNKGRTADTLGSAGCFSFYPSKNVGAFGEAGAVVTDNAPAAGKILTLRDHDQIRKYRHSMIGWNRRTNGIQTAVLGVKSRHWKPEMRSVAGTSSDMTPRRVGCAHSSMESLPPCL